MLYGPLLQEIRDRTRVIASARLAPLRSVADAIELDTTGMIVDAAVAEVGRCLKKGHQGAMSPPARGFFN